MSGGIARLFTQSASVETKTGANALGDVYAAPVDVACFVQDGVKMVRSTTAAEVVSSTTLYAPLSASPTSPPTAGQFAPGSKVTVNGRVAYVIAAVRQDSAGPSRIHHVAVSLT